eukprot:11001791-Prorocentrum_lima.AAC.1
MVNLGPLLFYQKLWLRWKREGANRGKGMRLRKSKERVTKETAKNEEINHQWCGALLLMGLLVMM